MENQNSVCYVARINEIKTIEGADNIDLAIVGGWNCIIPKGQYIEGDLVIIATNDAVIPQELSDKVGVTNYLRKGGRVRTVKLKGVYSECLIIKSEFVGLTQSQLIEGADCMEILGITKYEPPITLIQLSSGRTIKYQDNPNFHIYYKFPNIKNVPGIFSEEDYVEITRKIHGTSCRYGIIRKNKLFIWDKIKVFLNYKFNIGGDKWKWIEYEYVYGSHNLEKGSDSQGFYSTDVWKTISERYDIKDKLWKYVKKFDPYHVQDGIILYGEIYGMGIQKNYEYGLETIEFKAFDIKFRGDYLSPIQTQYIVTETLELPYVEILHDGKWSQDIQDELTFKKFIEGTKIPHEGIVIKYFTGERNKVAKVINPEYLIYAENKKVGDSH